MAGQSRTLKLSILADVDQLKKSLNTANNDVENSSSKLGDFSKKAGLAFAAAGVAAAAYAGKLLIDGVKAAIEDEAGQVRLANALKNTVGATDDAIAAAEKYILKQSLATGVTDDELRPALERLTRSTKDIAEAQKLTNLALDIAKAKNLDVTIVANALAKANDGQTTALKKLGITLGDNATNLGDYNKLQKALEKAQLEVNFALDEYGPKSKEYVSATEKVAEITEKSNALAMAGIDIFGELGKEFAGAAAEAADTFQGKMARLNIAFAEGKETVGSFVLDAITPMVTSFVDDVVPAVAAFAEEIGLKLQPIITFLSDYIKETFIPTLKAIWSFLTDFLIPIITTIFGPAIEELRKIFVKVQTAIAKNTDELQPFYDLMKAIGIFARDTLAPILGTVLHGAFKVLGTIISVAVDGFTGIVKAVDNTVKAVKAFIKLMTDNPITRFFGGGSANDGKSKGLVASVDLSTGDLSGVSGSTGDMTVTGSGSVADLRALDNAQAASVINVTVNGAIDPEGTSRTIVDVLNNSYYRGTGGAGNLIAV